MDKIIVKRIAQTVPVLNEELKPDTSLEQFLNNIIGVTFKKSINKGQRVEEQLVDNSKTKEELTLLRNVLEENHGAMLEHVYLTYVVVNASRSFLAQQTRHRMMSYASSSQHYIDHSEMNDAEVPVEIIECDNPEVLDVYLGGYSSAKEAYNKLVNEYGIDHSVARQLLPNAQRNVLVITANVRSWLNYMNLRICFRNTSEILYVAKLIRDDMKKIIPISTEYMVPDCVKLGHCTQKHMTCGEKWTEDNLDAKFEALTEKQLIDAGDFETLALLYAEKYGIIDYTVDGSKIVYDELRPAYLAEPTRIITHSHDFITKENEAKEQVVTAGKQKVKKKD